MTTRLGGAGTATLVDVHQLMPNPWNPREEYSPGYVEELAQSIEANGLAQYPLVRRSDGGYQVAAGWTRVLAYRHLAATNGGGHSQIPVLVRELTDDQMSMLGLEENRKRRNLTALEEARALKRTVEEQGLTQTEVARRLGLDQATVSNMIRVLGLPPKVLELVAEGKISFRDARELLCLRGKGCGHKHDEVMEAIAIQAARFADEPGRGLNVRHFLDRMHVIYYGQFKKLYKKHFRLLKSPNDFDTHNVNLDVAAFTDRFKHQLHRMPGGKLLTCNVGAFEEWNSREAKKKAEERKKRLSEPRAQQYLKDNPSLPPIVTGESWSFDSEEGIGRYSTDTRPATHQDFIPEQPGQRPVAGPKVVPKDIDLAKAQELLPQVLYDFTKVSREVYGQGAVRHGQESGERLQPGFQVRRYRPVAGRPDGDGGEEAHLRSVA